MLNYNQTDFLSYSKINKYVDSNSSLFLLLRMINKNEYNVLVEDISFTGYLLVKVILNYQKNVKNIANRLKG